MLLRDRTKLKDLEWFQRKAPVSFTSQNLDTLSHRHSHARTCIPHPINASDVLLVFALVCDVIVIVLYSTCSVYRSLLLCAPLCVCVCVPVFMDAWLQVCFHVYVL